MSIGHLTDADFAPSTVSTTPVDKGAALSDSDFAPEAAAPSVSEPPEPQATTLLSDKNIVVGHPMDMSHDQVNDAIQTQIYAKPRNNFHEDAGPLESAALNSLKTTLVGLPFHIADATPPTASDAKSILPETGKAAFRGIENIGKGVAGLAKWVGEVIQSPGVDVDGKPLPADKDLVNKMVQHAGKGLAEIGQSAADYLNRRQKAGFEAPDPEIFRGSFVSNPSFSRLAANVAEGAPTLAAATALTLATGNPLAGAGALGLVGAGEQYAASREQGSSVPRGSIAAVTSGIGNTLLMSLPLGKALEGFGPTVAESALKGAAEFTGITAVMTPFNNIVAKFGGDKSRKLFDGMTESLLSAAVSGGILGGFTPGRGAEIDALIQDAHKAGVPAKEIDAARSEIARQMIDNPEAVTGALKESKVYADIKTQLSDIEKPASMTPEQWEKNIEAGSQLWAARVASEARKRGETVDQAYDRMRPTIVGAEFGAPVETPSGEEAVVSHAAIMDEAQRLYEDALMKRGPAGELEKFVQDNGGFRANQGEAEEHAAVPLRFKGPNHTADEMAQMAFDRGLISEPSGDALREELKAIPKRGAIPKFADFVDEAQHNLSEQYAQREPTAGDEGAYFQKPQPEIPSFKGSQDAIKFGVDNVGRQDVIDTLKAKMDEAEANFNNAMTADDGKALNKYAFERQFYREALEAAQGKLTEKGYTNNPETLYQRDAEAPELQEKALKTFGQTDNIDKAGFILPDGKMVDFTHGGDVKVFMHQDISEIFKGTGRIDDPPSLLREFMGKTGAVRLSDYDEVNGKHMSVESPGPLSDEQLRSIGEYLESGKASSVTFEVVDPIGRPIRAKSFAEPTGADLARFFNGSSTYFQSKVDPTFFSQVERTIDEKMPAKASGEQLAGLLKNTPGIKQEELDWIGLPEFLQGKKSVTKEEVQNFIKQNNVQVKEVMKRSEPEPFKVRQDPGMPGRFEIIGDNETFHQRGFETEEDAANAARQLVHSSQADQTKFSKYTLPGGENYRELLLTLPGSTLPEGWRVEQIPPGEPGEGKFALYNQNGSHMGNWPTRESAEKSQQRQAGSKGFFSSHFDEPNILAHVRFNDRIDATGKKTLFIEEVQSDWHQKGRDRGYQGDTPDEFKVPYPDKFTPEDIKITQTEHQYIATSSKYPGIDFKVPVGKGTVSTEQEAIEYAARYFNTKAEETNHQIRLVQSEKGSKVPDAPFKKTWHELALKRMLRYAAENGYDQIAWTTGEQQAERYDLSKQISRVTYNAPGTKMAGKYGTVLKAFDKSGEEIINRIATPDQLPDYIGKEAAKKLLEAEVKGDKHELSGVDLKVGGEGMKGFYDQIVPSFLNKYAKKWGGKVGESKLDYPIDQDRIYSGPEYTGEEVGAAYDKLNRQHPYSDYSSPFTGKKLDYPPSNVSNLGALKKLYQEMELGTSFAEAMRKHRTGAVVEMMGGKMVPPPTKIDSINVHSLDITPSMKESVMQGQPLFQGPENGPRGATSFTPEKTIIKLFKNADASTFLHESAHAWLQDIHDFVKSGKADEKYMADWKKVGDWLGIKEGAKRLTTEQHEKFARGFESYLRDGVSPTPQLQLVFDKFKDWLSKIYRSAQDLKVEIPDEVRGVMDDMVRAATPDTADNKYVKNRPFDVEMGTNDKTTARTLREEFSGIKNEQIVRGNQLSAEIKRAVPSKEERQGMFWYKAAKGDMNVLADALSDPRLKDYHDQITAAMGLSPKAVEALKRVGQYYDEAGRVSQEIGTIRSIRENYQNRIYAPEKPQDFVKTETKSGIKPSTKHALRRVFDTEFEAAQAGKKFATTDVADALSIHNEELARANTSRKMADAMADSGLGAWKREVPDGWAQVGTLEKRVPIKDKEGNAVIGEDGNQAVSHSLFVAPEGISKGLAAIADPNFAKKIDSVRELQRYQGLVKTVDLSFSFFHHFSMAMQSLYQGGFRALLHLPTLDQHLNTPEFDALEQDFTQHTGMTAKVEANQDILRNLVQHNEDYFSKVSNLPGVKNILETAQKSSEFLFGKVQRFLKVSDYGEKISNWVADHPNATNAEVRAAKLGFAKQINSVYGGLNWEAIGMTKSNLSLLRLGLLAPDWTISNVQLLQYALGDSGTAGKASRAHVLMALVSGMALTEGVNKLLTGHFTDENKKGHELEVEISPDVYVSFLRGGIGDITKFASMVRESGLQGVARFTQGKLAPFPRTAVGLLTNTQYTGRAISHKARGPIGNTYDVMKFLLSSLVPMPLGVSNFLQMIKDEKITPQGAAAVLTGVGRYSKSGSNSAKLKM